MASIRDAEARFCTSVYYLTSTTRCERLARELSTRWLMQFTSPPALPPGALAPAAAIPAPTTAAPVPTPAIADGLVYANTTRVRLSTYRFPTQLPTGATADDFGVHTTDENQLAATVEAMPLDRRACAPDGAAPLACATGTFVATCRNGMRRCGDEAANARDPHVEFDVELPPRTYLYQVVLRLPRNVQLAELAVGAKELWVYGPRDEPVACAHANDDVIGLDTESWTVTIRCHGAHTDDDGVRALAGARRARLTLVGEARQLWLDQLQIVARPIEAAGVAPAAPVVGTTPPTPPTPPSPPPTACEFEWRTNVDAAAVEASFVEPCGVSRDACCAAMYERGDPVRHAFTLDAAGCCTILRLLADRTFPGVVTGYSGVWGVGVGGVRYET